MAMKWKTPCFTFIFLSNSQVHYLYFAMILFWLTVGICIAVSLLTEPPESFRVSRTALFRAFNEVAIYAFNILHILSLILNR